MKIERVGWLAEFSRLCRDRCAALSAAAGAAGTAGAAGVRAACEEIVERSGLGWGLPLLAAPLREATAGWGRDPLLAPALALLQARLDVACAAAAAAGAALAGEAGVGDLLAALALWEERPDLAAALAAPAAPWGAPRALESIYAERLAALRSAAGLSVAAGAFAIDLQSVGEALFHAFRERKTGTLAVAAGASEEAFSRARQERRALAVALAAMAWADGRLLRSERRLLSAQLLCSRRALCDALPASPAEARAALDAFPWGELPPRAGGLIIEQMILLSLVDDEQHPLEVALFEELAARLGLGAESVYHSQMRMIEFYQAHRGALRAVFSLDVIGRVERFLAARLRAVLVANRERLVREIQDTSDLMALFVKANHERLSAAERERVAQGLLEVAKKIPAIGIFLLPGGGLLLPILFRILPASLVPRSFQEQMGVAE
jgi:hypothetical protein